MKVDVKLSKEDILNKDFSTLMQDALKKAFRWEKPIYVDENKADFHCCSNCKPVYSIQFSLYDQIGIVREMQTGYMFAESISILMYIPDHIYK